MTTKNTTLAKNILTIGLSLASASAHEEAFQSKASLLDWDIILFRPTFNEFLHSYEDYYKGKPSLGDASSFLLKESCEHWRREIKQAVDSRKTVIVFLTSLMEVYIDTGRREYSGTGRNQRTTRIVDLYTNYNALPLPFKPGVAEGSAMKLAPLGAEILAPYWAEFAAASKYKVILPPEAKTISITTKNGDRPVGAISRNDSGGVLVLLPDIDFDQDTFSEEVDSKIAWSPEAEQFAARMIAAVVALDKALHSSADVTPEPDWATADAYTLGQERNLRSELLEAEHQVEQAQRRKEDIYERLKDAGRLRALLYEKGKPLENAIIEALKLLGFQATNYRDADSEFDVVFESAEGRLIGEVEGKDTKPISVDKLRQLTMNIHEDLRGDEVKLPAKGVLFGNGYRLSPPEGREVQFTEKCINASRSSSTALVATSELFAAARYFVEQSDENYEKLCREAILTGVGLVALPAPPIKPPESTKGSDVSSAEPSGRKRLQRFDPVALEILCLLALSASEKRGGQFRDRRARRAR